jgi:hypothetical protein
MARASRNRQARPPYRAPGAKGSVVVGLGGFTPKDMRTFKISIDLLGSPGLGSA